MTKAPLVWSSLPWWVVAAGLGCATHTAQRYERADILYPPLTAEQCSDSSSHSMLSIQVRDSQGLEIPEARLTVATLGTPRGGVEPTLQQQATSTAGHAAFELAPGFYTVTASMIGFVPRVVPIEVKPGCSGKRLIVLPVASTERLEKLVQRSQSERP